MVLISGSTIKILDRTIFIFILIFILSLSNSIFVNQIGYFGALFFMLLRFAITRENKFGKTGLEFAFAWFILAEILSAIFSEYQSVAFNNVLKRAILIPVIYTMIAAATDYKSGKTFFKVYIVGTVLTFLVYIYFSYEHFVNNLYGLTQSGPSIFQYPITTSEIISFTVIFLFAFLVNEKTNLKYKLLIFAGFAVSTLALISTFKRTGWIGTACGIVVILIMKKQWKLLSAFTALIILAFIFEQNVSEIKIFEMADKELKKVYEFSTEGRASGFYSLGDEYLVPDFENGLSIYRDDKLIKNIKLSAPVTSISHLREDFYLTCLYDTRFLILKKEGANFSEVNELVSPGLTITYSFANDMLYVLDLDSGLTVFTEPFENDKQYRFVETTGAKKLFADSSYIYWLKDGDLQSSKLKSFLPIDEIDPKLQDDFSTFYVTNGIILIGSGDNVELRNSNFKLIGSIPVGSQVSRIIGSNESLFLLLQNNKLLELNYPFEDSLYIKSTFNLGFTPSSIYIDKNKIYTSIVKRSRLLSIFDPYIPSNYTRLALWRVGFEIFRDYPLFGVGDMDLADYHRKYKSKNDKEIHGHLHNNFMHILVTLGLFGFLAVCFIFIKIIMIDLKIYREVITVPFVSSYALGALATFCSFLVSGLTEMNFWDQEITTLIWFTFGLNVALYQYVKINANNQNL